MSHSARKAAFSAIGETCPHVDRAFDDMLYDIKWLTVEELGGNLLDSLVSICIDRIKEQTEALRNSLILAYEEKEESENDLKDQICTLEQRIDDLENQIE